MIALRSIVVGALLLVLTGCIIPAYPLEQWAYCGGIHEVVNEKIVPETYERIKFCYNDRDDCENEVADRLIARYKNWERFEKGDNFLNYAAYFLAYDEEGLTIASGSCSLDIANNSRVKD